MKRIRLAAGLCLTILFVAACSANNVTTTPSEGGQAPATGQGAGAPQFSSLLKTDYENALPIATQLAIGLFKLEETDTPLSAEQAAALLPLWKAYKSLSASDSSSPMELDALITQIQETISTDQLQAIADIKLTGEMLMQLSQERNINLGGSGGGRMSGLSAEEMATRQAMRESGQAPGGGGGFGPPGGGGGFDPAMGGGMAPGAQMTPVAGATPQAARPNMGAGRVSSGLVDALIEYLKTLS